MTDLDPSALSDEELAKELNQMAPKARAEFSRRLSARRDKEPCRFPEKLRYSLESLGANVGALAADKLGAPLQWGTKDAPPEYFVLVGAVLTKGE